MRAANTAEIYTISVARDAGRGVGVTLALSGSQWDPAWSPDGESILFTSLRGRQQSIFSLTLQNGTYHHHLSFVDVSEPSWIPDGDGFVFTKCCGPAVYEKQSGFIGLRVPFAGQPAYSPNRRNIVYVRGGDIWVRLNLFCGSCGSKRFTHSAAKDGAPDWRPV